MIKKTIRVGLLAFASLLTFSACSSDDNNTPTEQGASSLLPNDARSFISQYFSGYNTSNVEKLSAANTNGVTYIATMTLHLI